VTQDEDVHLLTTPFGNLRARKVLVCANGYTGYLISGLRQTVVPIHSVQVAPAPLSGNLCATSFPGLHVPSDTRRRLSYFRTYAAWRFIMEARGAYTPGATRARLAQTRAVSVQLFSQLADVQWEYEWGGYIAATGDHYPHLHDLADWASGVP
jgi:glycine/D-amino acid oxidase-like deaminating enzyme